VDRKRKTDNHNRSRVNDCVDSLVMLFDWDVCQDLERETDPNLSSGWREHRQEAIVIAGAAP